ncbi:flavonol sulfotransferase-like protein, partial [Trifolium medium]|nr:flavonol sulfotransferase-like protein [Trifolium medium]
MADEFCDSYHFSEFSVHRHCITSMECLDNLDDSVSAAVNLAKQSYGKNNFPKIDKKCTYCHKTNHIVDNCFRKHGFPPGYRFKDGTVVGSRNQGQASANYVDADESDVKSTMDNRVATFSSEEYQALMALLRSNAKSAGEGPSQVNSITKRIASSYNDKQGIVPNHLDTWIIDSGATDHVCAALSLFTAYRK